MSLRQTRKVRLSPGKARPPGGRGVRRGGLFLMLRRLRLGGDRQEADWGPEPSAPARPSERALVADRGLWGRCPE